MRSLLSLWDNKRMCNNNDYSDRYIVKISNEPQIDRIQQLHHIMRGCCNGTNHFSPIYQELNRGIEVLDIGSGPGTWIFDMSSDYPNSQFTGIEIQSFMLPTIHPMNTNFIHGDVIEGIPFPPNTFDYIHMRFMALCFTEQQYENIIKELVELLRPNAYLELCEPELCSKNMGPISEKLSSELGKFLRKKSINPHISERLHELMDKLGLNQIRKEVIMLPLSELDGKHGALYGRITFSGLVGLKDSLAKQMKISNSEMNRLLRDYLQELRTVRMYVKYTRIYGVK